MNQPIANLCQKRIGPTCALLTGLIGAAGLAGWVFDIPGLRSVGPSGIAMKANTALCLVLVSGAYFCLRKHGAGGFRTAAGFALAAVASGVGLLTLVQYATGLNLGIDQLLFEEAPGSPATSSPGRMGFPASLSFSLAGTALVADGLRRPLLAQACGVAIAAVTAISIIGYTYGVVTLYGHPPYTGIALHTALALMSFAIGVVTMRPTSGFMAVLCSDSAGGIMARRLILPGLMLPFAVGWLRVFAEEAHWIDHQLGPPIMVVILTVMLVALIFVNSRAMTLLERRRLAAEREKNEALTRTTEQLQAAIRDAALARDAAEKASRAKSDFIATLSHELRTPLSPALLTLSNLEQDRDLPPEVRHELSLVRKNLLLETKLISDLLDLTRIERQRLDLETSEVDIHEVLRDVVRMCANGDAAPISFDFKASASCVSGDDTRLHQVFWNLISNAQKFTPSSGQILIATDNAKPGRIRIRVIDSGDGIPPSTLDRLFNAFEQGEVPGRRRVGLGLGLSITRNLVEAHHGTVVGTSAGSGQGSTFTVELPVLTPRSIVPASTSPTARPAGRKLRILLVEDHAATQLVLRKILTNLGHTVATASSVADALHVGTTGEHDVLISDLGLPDGTGLDLMKAFGTRFHGRAIALSGYGMESDVNSSRAVGFRVHLTKPVEVSAVLAALQELDAAGAPPHALPPAEREAGTPISFPPETTSTRIPSIPPRPSHFAPAPKT